ncbi:MAG: orotidine-5'-phosphate decarboxylase [Armatimonadota bacterium]
MAAHFADRLMDAIAAKNSRVCVGIDPVIERMPVHLQPHEWYSPASVAKDVRGFCQPLMRAVAEVAVAVKFNSAFFEALGPAGPELLQDLIGVALSLDLLVLADAKRGDVGSTAELYARAVFADYVPFPMRHPDAVTVNPYAGSDGVLPFVAQAQRFGGGVFVLVKTSNPSSAEIQDLDAGGKPVYRHVAELVRRWGEGREGASGYSSVGAVVGATWPEQLVELRAAMPRTPLLVPGYGAQGAGAQDVVAAFDDQGLGAIVNSSRAIIFAYASEPYASRFGPEQFDLAAAAAAREMRDEINRALGA